MKLGNLLAVRPEGEAGSLAHLVFRTQPNFSLCGVRLVGKWRPVREGGTGDRTCTKCWASYSRQARDEEARLAAWQAGEARGEGPAEAGRAEGRTD